VKGIGRSSGKGWVGVLAGLIVFQSSILVCIGAAAPVAAEAAPGAKENAEAVPPSQAKSAGAETSPSTAPEREDKRYAVSEFAVSYNRDHPDHPPLQGLMESVIQLGKVPEGYVAPSEGLTTVKRKLSSMPEGTQFFYASAIRSICQQLVDALNARGLMGVYVAVDEKDIEPDSGQDLRAEDKTLHLVIWTTIVTEVRTIASGERVPSEDRINSKLHMRIREGSPIKPARGGERERRDLLRKDVLNDYVYRLNRHPGRRVDVAVSSAGEPGEAVLDYLVAENRPWTAYFQLSNTGTEHTNEWHERFGFIHNQLTGRDDIFSLDYITGGFDEVQAVVVSYRIPLWWQKCDFRVYGSWNEYTASEVGLAKENFAGEAWLGGGEVIYNIFQHKQLFADLVCGARWQNIEVENKLFGTKGDEDFFLPYLGLQLKHNTQKAATEGYLGIEHNFSGIAGTRKDGVAKLGRLNTENEWTAMHWDVSHSFFLEPLIYGESWKDVTTPESSTLAHELSFSFGGQYAFGDRLIPQAEKVVGGTYTVRGYPESVTAGDDVYVARAEYRYHVPRAFRPNPNPRETTVFGRPFRFAPQHVFGQPDWDLVLKAFFDYGRVFNNYRLSSESDETLMSVGLGVELQLWRSMHLRCEWGHTLEELGNGAVDEGEDRLHAGLTLMW